MAKKVGKRTRQGGKIALSVHTLGAATLYPGLRAFALSARTAYGMQEQLRPRRNMKKDAKKIRKKIQVIDIFRNFAVFLQKYFLYT